MPCNSRQKRYLHNVVSQFLAENLRLLEPFFSCKFSDLKNLEMFIASLGSNRSRKDFNSSWTAIYNWRTSNPQYKSVLLASNKHRHAMRARVIFPQMGGLTETLQVMSTFLQKERVLTRKRTKMSNLLKHRYFVVDCLCCGNNCNQK